MGAKSIPNTEKMKRRSVVLQQREHDTTSEKSLGQFVLVGVGSSTFGFSGEMLKEVVPTPPITHLPNTPNWMHGLVQLRGSLLSAVDIGRLFDLRTSRKLSYLVVLDTPKGLLGVLVDSVIGFEEIHESDIADRFENVANGQERPVKAVTKEMVSIIDVTRLLEIVDLSAGSEA